MEQLIHNFGIDWKLLIAQAVNFFILLALLKKFAYGPVLEILRKRKVRIEDGVRFAYEAEEKLRESGLLQEAILKDAHKEALSIVGASENTAKKRKDEIITESNEKVKIIIADARQAIEEEKAKIGDEVFREAKDLVRLGIMKVLGKLSPGDRDEALIQEALRELTSVKLK